MKSKALMISLIIGVVYSIVWFSPAQCQYELKSIYFDTIRVSDEEVRFNYFDDSTIIMAARYQGLYLLNEGRHSNQYLYPAYEILKYNSYRQRLERLIEEPFPSGSFFRSSSGKDKILYKSSGMRSNTIYILDVKKNEKLQLDVPDSFWVRDFLWHPKEEYILFGGYRVDPEDILNRFRPGPVPFMYGPKFYMYYPKSGEWQFLFGDTIMYGNEFPRPQFVWNKNGKSIFVLYDSGGARGVPMTDYLIKNDIDFDKLDTIYAGPLLKASMVEGVYANDTSILFINKNINYVVYEDIIWGIMSLNPETMQFTKFWAYEDKTRPGSVINPIISPDRQFVAYYTGEEFVVERVGNGSPEPVHRHRVWLGGFREDAAFSDDSRWIVYSIEYIPDGKYEGDRKHYGSLKFGWGEIGEVEK